MANADLQGLLAAYAGPRFDVHKLRQQELLEDEDELCLPRIRAFAIPCLTGGQVHVHGDSELPAAIARLLTERLPGWNWDTSKVTPGPFRKYHLVHACLPAPKDLATDQPMCLELWGKLIAIDGLDLDTEAGNAWRDEQIRRRFDPRHGLDWSTEVTGAMVVEIQAATYSNVAYLGVDMPFYM